MEDKISIKEQISDLDKSMGISIMYMQILLELEKRDNQNYTYYEIIEILDSAERNAVSEITLLKLKDNGKEI